MHFSSSLDFLNSCGLKWQNLPFGSRTALQPGYLAMSRVGFAFMVYFPLYYIASLLTLSLFKVSLAFYSLVLFSLYYCSCVM
jgi:hypothetical protein